MTNTMQLLKMISFLKKEKCNTQEAINKDKNLYSNIFGKCCDNVNFRIGWNGLVYYNKEYLATYQSCIEIAKFLIENCNVTENGIVIFPSGTKVRICKLDFKASSDNFVLYDDSKAIIYLPEFLFASCPIKNYVHTEFLYRMFLDLGKEQIKNDCFDIKDIEKKVKSTNLLIQKKYALSNMIEKIKQSILTNVEVNYYQEKLFSLEDRYVGQSYELFSNDKLVELHENSKKMNFNKKLSELLKQNDPYSIVVESIIEDIHSKDKTFDFDKNSIEIDFESDGETISYSVSTHPFRNECDYMSGKILI